MPNLLKRLKIIQSAIDARVSDYLLYTYGHASFVIIDEVRKLPLKVADIYRQLTT